MRTQAAQRFPILKPFPTDYDFFRGGRHREIRRVYIHCSATGQGDAEAFDYYHRVQNGWNQIGYHFVINNGAGDKIGFPAGIIQMGRPMSKQGAHVKGDNAYTIGICLVGNWDFELFDILDARVQSAIYLTEALIEAFSPEVLLHRDAGKVPGVPNPGKTCPGKNFDGGAFEQCLLDQLGRHPARLLYEQIYKSFIQRYRGYKVI